MRTIDNKNKRTASALVFRLTILSLFGLISFDSIAQFTVTKTSGNACVNAVNVFQFNASGSCATRTWSVGGGGTIISGQNSNTVTVKWPAATSSANVSIAYGCPSGSGTAWSTTFVISNNVTPGVNINLSTTSVCQGSSVGFTPAPVNGGSSPSYTWYVDSSPVGSGSSFSYTGGPGGHSAYVVMTSNLLCVSPTTATSSVKTFTINAPTSYSAMLNSPGTLCTGTGTASFTFVATASGSYNTLSYQWYKNDSPVATTTTFNTTLTEGDRVYCIVSSTGCTNSPQTTGTFTTHYIPAVTPTASIQVNKTNFCSGETMTLTRGGNSGTSYSWKLNGNQFSTNSSTSLPVSTDVNAANTFSPGDVITLDVSGISGTCFTTTTASASSSGIPITITPTVTPSVFISLGNSFVCPGVTTTLTANPTNGGTSPTYEWRVDGVVVSNPNGASYTTSPSLSSGSHSVTVKLFTTAQCPSVPSVSSVPQNVTVNTPTLINAGTDINLTLPTRTVTLNATATDPDAPPSIFTWTKLPGTTGVMEQPNALSNTIRKLEAGTNTFRLTTGDQCGSYFDDINVIVGYPVNNYNWIRETTVLVKDKLLESDVTPLSIANNEKSVHWVYYDGLGRNLQSVDLQSSPQQTDIVMPAVFDANSREFRKYLPVAINNGATPGYYSPAIVDNATGNYTGMAAGIYQVGSNNNIADDTRPFSEITYEASLAARPMKEQGPGSEWVTANKSVNYKYSVYTYSLTASDMISEKVVIWRIILSGGVPVPVRNTDPTINGGIGYYPSNSLVIKISYDENGYQTREYTDALGRMVLKKVQVLPSATSLFVAAQWATTYYIYDDFGNLRFVIPPVVSKVVASTDVFVPSIVELNNSCYQYQYDARQRLISKRLPGADEIYIVYDKYDRVVMMQDGNLRKDPTGVALKQWIYTKYDVLNRPVLTGIYTHTTAIDQPTMSALISTTNMYETYSSPSGYGNVVFPTSSTSLLTTTYYDNYNFKTDLAGASYNYDNAHLSGITTTENTSVIGLVTGSRINVLGTANQLWNANYFDEKYRLTQVKKQNHKLNIDTESSLYDFARLTQVKTTNVGAVTISTHRKFDYDNGGRIKKVYHKFDNTPTFIALKENTYNLIGQLITKNLHSRDGSPYLQTVDLSYNIRGWLTKINDPYNPSTSDMFSMELKYNSPTVNGGTAQYDGNISEVIWNTAGSDRQSYAYKYDVLKRLTEGKYYNLLRPTKNGRYTEQIGDPLANPVRDAYDLQGNILNLIRYGKGPSAYGKMDDLVYTYTGNQVNRIDDSQNTASLDGGFTELVTAANEYLYDWNGNMKKDDNKGLTKITYNQLNHPVRVERTATEYMIYTYDALGNKVTQQVFGTTPKTTDYIGELVFENNTLVSARHEEGRIVASAPGSPNSWDYQYFLNDHLGNTRAVLSENSIVTNYSTDFESSTAPFGNYNQLGVLNIFDHTDAGTTYTRSHMLTGGYSKQIGVSKSLAVNPGDVVDMEVYAKYEAPTGTTADLSTLFQGLVTAFTLQATGGVGIDGQQAYNAINSLYPGVPHLTPGELENTSAPRAYLNYLLFDENFVLVDYGFDQVSIDAQQVGISPVVPHDYLSLRIRVSQKGYLYVYASNEQPFQTNVYFDDFKVVHHSALVQANDYYPFGLTFNSFNAAGSTPNQYQYNGKEMQDELNVGWLDYGERMYMAEVGRWGSVDLSSEKYYPVTPYSYCFSNPIKFLDPTGKDPIDPTTGKELNVDLYESSVYLLSNEYRAVSDRSLLKKIDEERFWGLERSGSGKSFDESDFPGRPERAQSLWETSPAAISQLGTLTGSTDPSFSSMAPNDFMWTKAAELGSYTFIDQSKSESEGLRWNNTQFNVITVTQNFVTQVINLTRSGEDNSRFNIRAVTKYETTKSNVETRTVSTWFGLRSEQQQYRKLTTVATTTLYQNNQPTKNVFKTTYNSEQIMK